jgi:hypothetical protein
MEPQLVRVDVSALEQLPVGLRSDAAEQLSRCAASCIQTHRPSVKPARATEPPTGQTGTRARQPLST